MKKRIEVWLVFTNHCLGMLQDWWLSFFKDIAGPLSTKTAEVLLNTERHLSDLMTQSTSFLIFLLLCWCGCHTPASDKNAVTAISLTQTNSIIDSLVVQYCPTLDIFILHLHFDLILGKMFKTFSKAASGAGNMHFIFDTKHILDFFGGEGEKVGGGKGGWEWEGPVKFELLLV